MRRHILLLLAGMALAGSLLISVPAQAQPWFGGGAGLGISYAGGSPYAAGFYGPPVYPAPVFYPPVYVLPVPPVYWPGLGPQIAVRWNSYFDPRDQQIRGYTLPR